MMRTLRRVSVTDVAYVLLLLAFVALGTFVYALATDSALAGVIGGSLVVLMVASVVGFRIGARNRRSPTTVASRSKARMSGLNPCAASRSTAICRATAGCGTGMSRWCRPTRPNRRD
jgi:hypothetical protein